jgi:hypothetical protein
MSGPPPKSGTNARARSRRTQAHRCLVSATLCCLLAGCAISRQLDQEEAPSVDLRGAVAECRNAYPDQITQAVVRADCIVKATGVVRSELPFPGLLDQENALRKSLAEQVQAGTISLLERNRQMSKLHAKLLAEEHATLRSGPPTDAKASVSATQWRMSNLDGCTSLGGNTENCY